MEVGGTRDLLGEAVPAVQSIRLVRIAGVLREITRGGLAGLIAGVLVGGVGGRFIMMVAAQLNPDAFGMVTEAGEVVGVFSLRGTFALVFFGGLSAGLLGAVVWVVVSPWVPLSGPRRWLMTMPVAVALGAFILVESTNIDFRILGSIELILALLLALVAANGAVVAWLDEALERRLPQPGSAPGRALAGYGVFAAVGMLPLALTLSAYLSESFSTGIMPFGVGYALLVVGGATFVGWVGRIMTGRAEPAPALVLVGRTGLVAAIALGAAHMASEVGRILAA